MMPTFFNGILTVLLANFMLNDLPHAAGLLDNPDYERRPTPRQLRYIAVLCQRLKMTVVYEERVRTFGEAGRMIRELEEEEKHRKWLKGGNPSHLRIERTTINTKMLDDLEAVWHRIESDRSPKMRSALEVLKRVMGHYFEQPAVAVYEDSNLVGIAAYGVLDDEDTGVRDIHLCELASFTYRPGVGKMLVDEVIKIAREIHADSVTVSYGPGAKGFYERLGFISDYKEGGGIKVGGQGENPNTADNGTCYPDAWRYVLRHSEAVLAHGSIVGLSGRMKHAWVELPDGTVWDPAAQATMPIERYYSLVDPIVEDRYTADEAALMLSVGKHGPWTAEERMEHIGR